MDKDDQEKTVSATESRKVSWENGELFRSFAGGLVSSTLLDSLKVFTESPTMQLIRSFRAQPVFQVGKAIMESPTIVAAQELSRAFETSFNRLMAAKTISGRSMGSMSIKELIELNSQLNQSVLASFLSAGTLDQLTKIARGVEGADVSVLARGEGGIATAGELEIDREIVEQLEQGNQSALTPEQRLRLQHVYLLILFVWAALSQWSSVQEGVCNLNARLGPDAPFAEIRRQIRTEFCGKPAASVRIVKGDNVNLRTEPGMKSEVITQLHKGLVVAVVSREDRDWLEVSFERDGYVIEGWVSRKFLQRVR